MNLNPAARQRHQVRVITIGFFRMLKSMQTYKVVKTRSEIAALLNFLDWIEKLRKADNGSQGVILLYHEERKFIPYMILEAFKKYNLTSRLLSSVRSFTNGYEFASAKCVNTVKYLNLRQLSKVLLNNEEDKNRNYFEGNASVRARLAYEIAQHLAKSELKELAPEQEMAPEQELENMVNVLYEYCHPVSQEIAELRNQRAILERQNSLRPIFLQYFKSTLYHRVRAVTYRRVLAEHGQDFDELKKLWTVKKREGIAASIEKLGELKAEDKTDLVDMIDCHFDPQKSPIKPSTKTRQKTPRSRRNSRRGRSNSNKENASPITLATNESTIVPDSTSKTPTKVEPKQLEAVETNNNIPTVELSVVPNEQTIPTN